jgi:two-component system KDP operon response regulator KdpE
MTTANVCVIDDDAGIRETLSFLLTDAGYAVCEAANGLDGWALLAASPAPLVVLLDYRMPTLDGSAFLQRVLQDSAVRTRHAFIMLSASPKQTAEECSAAIAMLRVDVVAKPFDIDELLAAVQAAQQRLPSAAA